MAVALLQTQALIPACPHLALSGQRRQAWRRAKGCFEVQTPVFSWKCMCSCLHVHYHLKKISETANHKMLHQVKDK
jgi:hypothetical protein